MCVQKAVTWAEPRSGNERSGFCRRSPVENQRYTIFQRSIIRTKSRGVPYGCDAPQTGMGRKKEFSGLDLHRMRMGVQAFGNNHRQIAR